jgi:hypothetical protein
MSRWLLFISCALLGLMLLLCGLLVPVHLRAVDVSVLAKAGQRTPALAEQGLTLVAHKAVGPAQLLLQAAQLETIPNHGKLELAVTNLASEQPDLLVFGASEPRFESLFSRSQPASQPFASLVLRLNNRELLLDFLRASHRTSVQELLACRALTNTVIFPASNSSSGQAFDAAVSICGLLLEQDRLSKGLADAMIDRTRSANQGGNPQALEQILMDLLSLGQRFNWGQLAAFVGQINDPETLRLLANQVRNAGDHMPVVFSAVQVSGDCAGVARYLLNFSKSGLKDLGISLRYNSGGVKELLRRGQPVYSSSLRQHLVDYDPFGSFFDFAVGYCWLMPDFSLIMKWIFYLGAGFLMALSLHYVRRAPSALEEPLRVRGFHIVREVLFALGFLLVVLLLSEPFLAQESQKAEFPFRLRLPTVGSLVANVTTNAHNTLMNKQNLLTMLLFFVLQGLIYTACLVKLAEIRRQRLPARTKLKLLENEEHLFDAGLYLGFAGTIVSLILVSLGVSKFSLMAAYSSTSFGIIFVSIFKIFHLRPSRRTLLLETEAAQPEISRTVASTLATPS